MPAWIPTLKAILPYLTDIVTTAIPAFSSRRNEDKSTDSVLKQIAELQNAVIKNAESIKLLAQQLEQTVEAVEEGAATFDQTIIQFRETLARSAQAQDALQQRTADLEKRLTRARLIGIVSMLCAVVSACAAFFIVAR